LAGKIEDYLTKEFVSFVHEISEGYRFAIVNSGKKGEPKIDMAIIKAASNGYTAESFIEAKYFRNRHRLSVKDMDAVDEHKNSFDELEKQLSFMPKETHGYHGVSLRSKTTKVYGLVFVSYVRPLEGEDLKDKYYRSFLERASKHNLKYHDHKKPYLRSVYEDMPVDVLGQRWLVTLRGALWRL